MLVFINGRFVPEKCAVVSVFDRSFLYGDGIFEALLVRSGKPFRWEQHLKRFQHGASFLKIKLPFAPEELRAFAGALMFKNKMTTAILRITLSRGVGVRGYSPKGANHPTLVMSLHPAPVVNLRILPKWQLVTTQFRLPTGSAFAQHKTNNRLAQVFARFQADAVNADESLLLDTNGHVVEGASSNLFWIDAGVVCTPPLSAGILPGVTRGLVLEVCQSLGLKTRERHVTLSRLKRMDGIFVSMTSRGVVAAKSLDQQPLKQSPLTKKIYSACWEKVYSETK